MKDKDEAEKIYQIDMSELAEMDLKEIIKYIKFQLLSPYAAAEMLELMEKAMASLTEMPQRIPLVADELLSAIGYRKLIVKRYIIFFTIDEAENIVNIERILYGRRNWLAIL